MGVSGGFAAMGVMSAGNAYAQGQSAKTQVDFAASQYRVNQTIATEEGSIAKSEGDIQASHMAREGNAEVAKQRVAAAATGANVNAGSALELQSDTKWQSTQNQITIKNNAWRQAWGYQVQANDYGTQAQMSGLAGSNAMTQSLLTGGMNAIGYGTQAYGAYRKYNGGRGPTVPTDGGD